MARTWSTFNAPPQWGKIQGIPSDFSDGKIDWEEIQNKPTSYNSSDSIAFSIPISDRLILGYPPYSAENNYMRSYIGSNIFWDSASSSWSRQNTDGNANASMIAFFPGEGALMATNDVFNSYPNDFTAAQLLSLIALSWTNSRVTLNRRLRLTSLPISINGLISGEVWRDSNGFLKAV